MFSPTVTLPEYCVGMSMFEIIVAASVLVCFLGLGVVLGVWFVRRTSEQTELAEYEMADAVNHVVSEALNSFRAESSQTMQASVDAVLNVASHKLGDQLSAGREVIDRERVTMASQVDHVQNELRRVGDLVATLQKERAEQSGQLTERLTRTLQATSALNDTTQSLRQALASPKSRGQWGERMAEDVLVAAGFIEGVNYRKQTKASGGGIPDYSFDLPNGHLVHMDVKFPLDNYLRWLEAPDDQSREQSVKAFRKDVRQRVKELATRQYIDAETTVDYVLLFVPNESVYGFLHEHDSDLIDHTLRQRVVLCSPTTLFAVLAVIRQAVDNFLVEKRSDEILTALGSLREEWNRWEEPMSKMERGLASAQRAYDDLATVRTRKLEYQLQKLEGFREGRPEEPLGQADEADEADSLLGVLKSA